MYWRSVQAPLEQNRNSDADQYGDGIAIKLETLSTPLQVPHTSQEIFREGFGK